MSAKCVSGKQRYASQLLAEDVLIELWAKNDYNHGHAPINVYRCDDCGDYHLTSRGQMNDRLSQAISSKQISLQKEAHKWMEKFKKK